MTASIDKLIHKVNSPTANLTCISTNGIAYQFVYMKLILMKDEYVECVPGLSLCRARTCLYHCVVSVRFTKLGFVSGGGASVDE